VSTQPSNSAHPSGISLRIAVLADKESVVRELVKLGHDINSRDSKGSTALIIAARMNRSRICQVLLDLGGDPFIKNFAGLDALQEAEQAAAGDSAEIIASYILEHPYETSEINITTDSVSFRKEVIVENHNTGDLKYPKNAIIPDVVNPESPVVTSAAKVEFITTKFLSEDIPLESGLFDGIHSIEIASASTVLSQIDFTEIRLSSNDSAQSILAHRQRVNRLKERTLVKEFSRFHPFKSTSELRFRNQCVFQLIKLGYSNSYLLKKDILFAIPDYNLTPDMVEILISMLNEMGIAIYEHSPPEDIIANDNTLKNSGQFEKNVLQSIEEININSSLAASFDSASGSLSIDTKYEKGESPKSEFHELEGELAQFEQIQEPKADSVEDIEFALGKVAPSLNDGITQVYALVEPIQSYALDTRVVRCLGPVITLGRDRGYVTHSDISECIFDKSVDADMFQLLIGFLEDIDIIVYERTPDFENLLLECIAAYSDDLSITSSEDQDLWGGTDDGSASRDANRFG